MDICSVCENPIEEKSIECANCGNEVHKKCCKKLSGKYYCKNCKKEGKEKSRYEKMSQRDRAFKG